MSPLPHSTLESATAEPGLAAPLVTLRNVSKRYASGTLALNDLNLSIERGSFVSLLGASGCGKSTALKMIAGFFPPSEGTIEWSSPSPLQRKPAAANTGFVFQDPTLMPWATALQNVRLALDLENVPAKEGNERSFDALASVGLAGFEDAYPRELSGGMKMRVSLARALVKQPELLLLDEPFAALDEITRFRLNEDISSLWEARKFTAIFVTHSVFESVFLSTRIIVMAAAPGRAFMEMDIASPGPRTAAFRATQTYTAMTAKATAALKAAMNAEATE